MSSQESKELDDFLIAMTANHKPELRADYMTEPNQKLINNDKNSADITLITRESAEIAGNFMTRIFGNNPFITQ